ncbi:MAG TPA: zinc-binding alcohol dehydrogenase [Spirochaetia bacterium]|nr:zinc-binding alcohol dehydrogenase [Spirochaetia bacterium]
MKAKARAIYFTAPGSIEMRQEEIYPASGSILVESRLIGISHGTEMLFFRGELPLGLDMDAAIEALRGKVSYPVKYGYMNTGVTETGRWVFAFYPHQDRFYVQEADTVPLPEGMNYEDAVFLANMETAVRIVQDAAPVLGDRILVVGQGVVGLLVAEILQRSHGGRIVTVEPYPKRREASQQTGCVSLSPAEPRIEDRIRELTDGRGVDVAINVSSSAQGLQLAIDSLAFSGKVVEASWYGDRSVALSLGSAFHRKRLKIVSSQVSTLAPELAGRWTKERGIRFSLDLVGEICPSKYITHRFPLGEAQEAFLLLSENPEETIQIVLVP